MQNLPATLKRGQPDLCHGDGRFGNSEGSDHFLRGRDVGADLRGQVTMMINSYYLLHASCGPGAVRSTRHLRSLPNNPLQ